MSDRYHGLLVSLNQDFRSEDLEPIVDAIRMIRGVTDVTEVVIDSDDWLNRSRIMQELKEKLWKALEQR